MGDGRRILTEFRFWKTKRFEHAHADSAISLADNEKDLGRVAYEFNCGCEIRELKINALKNSHGIGEEVIWCTGLWKEVAETM